MIKRLIKRLEKWLFTQQSCSNCEYWNLWRLDAHTNGVTRLNGTCDLHCVDLDVVESQSCPDWRHYE